MTFDIFLSIIPPLVVALVTTYLNNKYTQNREKNNKSRTVTEVKVRLAKAFWAEISSLIAIYDSHKISEYVDGSAINIEIVRIDSSYLSVFDNNTDKIGLFPADDAKEFLKFYLFLKSFIDTLRELSKRVETFNLLKVQLLLQRKTTAEGTLYFDSISPVQIEHDAFEDLKNLYRYTYNQQTELYEKVREMKPIFDKYNNAKIDIPKPESFFSDIRSKISF